MKTLEELRKEIDAIDHELVELLAKRMHVVDEVGKVKKELQIEPLDTNRWQEVLESKLAMARELGLSEEFVKKIYDFIHEHALELEKKVR